MSGQERKIAVCGCIGLKRALWYLREYRERLEEHFPFFFLKQLQEIGKNTENFCIENNTKTVYIREINKGGIFRALWEAGEDLDCGVRIRLSAIPVRQEVTEVLEFFGESPYECDSEGALLVIGSSGEMEGLAEIGRTTEERSRIVESRFGTRYLTPPVRQEKDLAQNNTAQRREP